VEIPDLGIVWVMTALTCTFEPSSKIPTDNDLRGDASKQLNRHHHLC
jgi:hypothetical protein